jgi:hypothetical protein
MRIASTICADCKRGTTDQRQLKDQGHNVRQTHARGSFETGNPFANLLVVVAGVIFIGISVLVSVFAFAVLGAVILVTAAIIGLRVWWLNRRLGRKATSKAGRRGGIRRPDVIEGEYRVVGSDDDPE